MARALSSQKRLRQSEKRRVRNRARISALKTQTRKLTDAVHAKDSATSEQEFRKTVRMLDQVAAKRTLHRNTAARRKSRLARRVNALKAAAT
ncbi:MAG: 30S ribosomal protein S20 [Phycisphaerae bacterium]